MVLLASVVFHLLNFSLNFLPFLVKQPRNSEVFVGNLLLDLFSNLVSFASVLVFCVCLAFLLKKRVFSWKSLLFWLVGSNILSWVMQELVNLKSTDQLCLTCLLNGQSLLMQSQNHQRCLVFYGSFLLSCIVVNVLFVLFWRRKLNIR